MAFYLKPTLKEKIDVYEQVLTDIGEYNDFYSCVTDREKKREALFSILHRWRRAQNESKYNRPMDEQYQEVRREFDRLKRREYINDINNELAKTILK